MQASPPPADGGQPTGVIEAPPPTALISGAPELLWSGAAAVVVIFTLVFWLLGRWRIGKRNRAAAGEAEFFQPAGEDAEITFDDAGGPAFVTPSAFETPSALQTNVELEQAASAPDERAGEPEPKKKRGAFGGLFGKREKQEAAEAEAAPEVIDLGADDQGLAAVRIERPARSVFGGEHAREDEAGTDAAAGWASIERAERQRAEEEAQRAAFADRQRAEAEEAEAERRRLFLEEENRRRFAEEDRRRAEREAALRLEEMQHRSMTPMPQAAQREDADARAAHDDIVRTLSEVEEALHAQREAIQAETRSLLDSFARRFSDRLDALAASVENHAARRAEAPAAPAQGAIDMSAVADFLSRRLDEHQSKAAQSMAALSKRIDAIGALAGGIAALREEMARLHHSLGARGTPSAPVVQLADVVRNALAPNAYEFNAVLPNGRRADCLVRLARPPGPIAIDARFPVEAFDALRDARADGESEFRRIALRHIVDIAERLIAPGVTADSAMMFIPSESMVADLHARFPDVVQDAYRARVWIVSPTTLMATLHTLGGVMREGASRIAAESDAERALHEIERLSERVGALESAAVVAREPAPSRAGPGRQRTGSGEAAVDDAVERSLQRLMQPTADNDSGHPNGDLYAEEEAVERAEEREETPGPARPPFPLR